MTNFEIGAFVIDNKGTFGNVIRVFPKTGKVKVMLANGLTVTDPITFWNKG